MAGDEQGRRPRRVAEQIRAHLAVLISRMGDARMASVVLTRVDVSSDLSVAQVSVRLLIGDDDPRARRAVLFALQRALSRLRRDLGAALALRRVPELRFSYDTAPDKRARVDELLGEIAEDRQRSQPDEE